MAKLDVGVGDEFPTEEIRRDPDGTIHHHHYYSRRPRRPFGFLRVILTIVWSGVVSIVSYYIVDKTIGLRVTEEDEREGLDISSHGETAYNR